MAHGDQAIALLRQMMAWETENCPRPFKLLEDGTWSCELCVSDPGPTKLEVKHDSDLKPFCFGELYVKVEALLAEIDKEEK